MKVVLLKDVKKTGRAGEVITTSDGHAQNFLIPRGLAVPATAANMKRAEIAAQQDKDRKALDIKLIQERLAALAEGSIVIRKKANEKGNLYDAVDAADIAHATDLPVDTIRLEKPVKELGTVTVPVSFGEQFGSIEIRIEAE